MGLAIGLLPGLVELFAGDYASRHLAERLRDDARLQRFGRGGVLPGQPCLDAGRHRAGHAQLHLGIVGGGSHRLDIDVLVDDGQPRPSGDQCDRHRQAEEDQEDPAQDAPPDRRAAVYSCPEPPGSGPSMIDVHLSWRSPSRLYSATHRCLMPRGKRTSLRCGSRRRGDGRVGASLTTRFAPQVPGVAQQRDTPHGRHRSKQLCSP